LQKGFVCIKRDDKRRTTVLERWSDGNALVSRVLLEIDCNRAPVCSDTELYFYGGHDDLTGWLVWDFTREEVRRAKIDPMDEILSGNRDLTAVIVGRPARHAGGFENLRLITTRGGDEQAWFRERFPKATAAALIDTSTVAVLQSGSLWLYDHKAGAAVELQRLPKAVDGTLECSRDGALLCSILHRGAPYRARIQVWDLRRKCLCSELQQHCPTVAAAYLNSQSRKALVYLRNAAMPEKDGELLEAELGTKSVQKLGRAGRPWSFASFICEGDRLVELSFRPARKPVLEEGTGREEVTITCQDLKTRETKVLARPDGVTVLSGTPGSVLSFSDNEDVIIADAVSGVTRARVKLREFAASCVALSAHARHFAYWDRSGDGVVGSIHDTPVVPRGLSGKIVPDAASISDDGLAVCTAVNGEKRCHVRLHDTRSGKVCAETWFPSRVRHCRFMPRLPAFLLCFENGDVRMIHHQSLQECAFFRGQGSEICAWWTSDDCELVAHWSHADGFVVRRLSDGEEIARFQFDAE
jgi:hypothetical protein